MGDGSSKDAGPSVPGSGVPRERRAAPRAAIEIPAVLHVGTREVDCTIRDLSAQGIALALKESVAPGMVARVTFRLPNSPQPIAISGVLVRAGGGWHDSRIGLQFIQPDADSLRVIGTFVARNRSDQPFSRERTGRRGAASLDKSESGAHLEGLYRRAVSEVAQKPRKRRGFFSRWRRGGE